ncbi:MAG TPA: hypothetical protein DCP92_04015 [Nitrospiraceae bacterium]|jgi:predicted aspartyl protease|nr:hypothetical protein [Nitrospiraceae bacterium]
MKGLLSSILLICFIAPAFAEENAVPSFTDQDLERYRYPSERTNPADQTSPKKTEIRGSPHLGQEERQNLRRYEVPYEASEGTVKRIVLPVTFNNSVTAQMLLDTGATGTLISGKLAEKLGIFKKDEGKLLTFVSGVGGTVMVIRAIIDRVKIGEAEDNFIPTVISDSIPEGFDGLIGMDFMANFTTKIDTRKHIVTFEELPHQSTMPDGHDEIWWKETFHEFASTRADWKKTKDKIYDLYSFQDASHLVQVSQKGKRTTTVTVGELRTYVDSQYEEAHKLLMKLDSYAIDHAVPMEWRDY